MYNFISQPHVIIVNEKDEALGVCEKIHAHKEAIMHRAVSAYLICQDKVLLQKRSIQKYHGGGLWTNAACTHPMYNETNEQAVERGLKKEIGIEIPPLIYLGSFIYKEQIGELSEYELDHIFLGEIEENIHFQLNSEEVEEVQFIEKTKLIEQMKNNPQQFTPWFHHVFNYIEKNKDL